jgi:large subunit ribosomal protein L35
MPKMKTRRAAAKRFRVNKNGTVKFKHAHMRHNLGHRTVKSKRKLRLNGSLREQDARHVRAMLCCE